MAPRMLLRRLHRWTVRHRWLTTLAFAVAGIVAIWLLPPRPDLEETILRVAFTLGMGLGLNFLIYRSFFPSPRQVDDDRRRADEIEAAVRRQRELDSRL
jgi:hypothetical protein